MTTTHLEHLLSRLTPAEPSAELFQRVEHDLALADKFRNADAPSLEAGELPRKPLLQPLTWASLGAAAAVVIMSTMQYSAHHPRSPGTSVAANTTAQHHLTTEIPAISNSREFIKVNDDGINFSLLGQPERRLRVKSIERQQWVDPRDGAVYIVETPIEHAIAVPVSIQ
jgi:hypothetical protein